jgi:hypothetical protein
MKVYGSELACLMVLGVLVDDSRPDRGGRIEDMGSVGGTHIFPPRTEGVWCDIPGDG